MKTIMVVFAVAVVVYLITALAVAKFFSVLILKTPKWLQPSYDDIRSQKVKEIANDKAVYAGIDWKEFDLWEREPFPVQNGDVTIRAELFPVPDQKGVVICAHGFGQNKLQEAPHAALFRELGYSAILYDQRHWGESTAPFCSFGYFEADDLAAVAAKVKETFGQDIPVVVTGVSMGGVTVMNAMGRTDKIDAVIDDCGFARFREGCYFVYKSLMYLPNPFVILMLLHAAHRLGIPMERNNPIDSVAESDMPLLVVHGDADRAVSVRDAYDIAKVMKNSKSRLEIFPGIDHGYCLSQREKYKRAVADFLKEVFHEE